MKNICCFGELLLRLSPVLHGEWIKNTSMPVYIGGAELNVAQALSSWNLPVKYCTALPDQYLSKEICSSLEEHHVDVSAIQWCGERIGTYYLPQGGDLKSSGVIYNREHSSFSELTPGMINWREVLKDVDWFHFSAINPALNQHLADVCKEALMVAREMGITISVDLNFRKQLWKYGKKPVEIMRELAPYCNVIMGNVWAAQDLLGIPLDPSIEKRTKDIFLQQSTATAKEIMRQFPACTTVAHTYRFEEIDGLRYYAVLETKEGQYISPEFVATKIISQVGSGDCFMAGLIYGLYKNGLPKNVIDFAAAAAFGKLQELGDATSQTVHDIKSTVLNYGKKDAALQAIVKQRILPLFFHHDADESIVILKSLYDAGIRVVEYASRGTNALANFKALKKVRDELMPDMQIGIATLKNETDARLFAQAGADFLVSPGFVPEIALVAQQYKMLWVPGCMNVSEIIAAENAGMYLVKLFPSNLLGATFVRSIRSIFPSMHFLPTGGIVMEQKAIEEWFDAGVSAVGIGSRLINTKQAVENYSAKVWELVQKAQSIIENTLKK